MSGPSSEPRSAPHRHILTVSTEEFFHGGALEDVVMRKHWDRFESRLEQNVNTVLKTLDQFGQKATFFVLGWTAERNPGLVRSIAAAGHEVASRGYWPRGVKGMMPEEFVEDTQRTRAVLEVEGGHRVLGYRSPRWLRRQDLWILEVLAEQGYSYDSSINPILRRFARAPEYHVLREHRLSHGRSLWEVPVSTQSYLGMRVAIAGGNYIRQLPRWMMDRAVRKWDRERDQPLVYYFNTWELDPEQPQITAVGFLNRIRQYRNLGKISGILEEYFTRYRFTSVADYLGLELQPFGAPDTPRAAAPEITLAEGDSRKVTDITCVVPMHNEEQSVPYLFKTLDVVRQRHSDSLAIQIVLVDDGSTDRTREVAQELIRGRNDVRLLCQDKNTGVAGAIAAGIRASDTEVVCSIDCDCSYDPNDVAHMVAMLLAGADMVTASPYHRDGQVMNVPGWRLVLSKTLSRMYSWVLGTDIATYTSCFRVYRRSAVADIELESGGFLGIAEFLVRLHRKGGRIVEFPTMLERRLLGESKMRIARTIRGHLRLLWRAWRKKI